MSAASWSGDFTRGHHAVASAPATSSASSARWTTWRSGIPRAWYWPQSQSENGESRPTCQRIVRSKKTLAA